MKIMNKNETKRGSEENEKGPRAIDIEGTGIFLSYQMLILLIGGLVSLGITISVWNSYDGSIQSNKTEISQIKREMNERFKTLDRKIDHKYLETIHKVDEKYEIIERRVDKNNLRFKDWIKKNSETIDEIQLDNIELFYTKQDKNKK
jgi:hypothetical protein